MNRTRIAAYPVLVIACIMLLLVPHAFADKLTVKALYEPPLHWYTHIEGFVLLNDGLGNLTVYDYTIEESYAVNSAMGLGFEYEFKRPESRVGLAFGMDYFFPRIFESVRQTATVAGHTATAETSLTDMSYQVTYFYGKLKTYINNNWFLAGTVRIPASMLEGSGWKDWFGPDVNISTYAGYGLSSGFYVDDLTFELAYVEDRIAFKHIDNGTDNGISVDVDRAPNSILSRLTLTCGYCFDLSAGTQSRAQKEQERINTEAKDIFKEPVPVPAVPTPAAASPDAQPVPFPGTDTENTSEAPVTVF